MARVGIQPDDARARRHKRIRIAIAQAQYAVEHVAFVFVDHALFVAFSNQVADLFFRYLLGRESAQAHDAQEKARAAS